MKKPLVTIAVPTYNRADSFLQETLECALGQTYENIEVLVSDNCSTDHTPELVVSFNNPKLKYYRQTENLGKTGNMKFLVNKAAGKYFLMLHDDDRIDPDFVETCIKAAAGKPDAGLILTGARSIDDDGEILRQRNNTLQTSDIEDLIIHWYQGDVDIYLCSTLYNTKVLREIGGFEEKYHGYDDVAAHFKCTAYAGRIDVPDIKASFRKHTESYTNTAALNIWCQSARALLDLSYSLASDKKKEVKKIGRWKSARNMYMYANRSDSKFVRLKENWRVFKFFNYRHLPPLKYCNEVVPLSGFVLHPYMTMSYIKNGIVKSFGSNEAAS